MRMVAILVLVRLPLLCLVVTVAFTIMKFRLDGGYDGDGGDVGDSGDDGDGGDVGDGVLIYCC